MFEDESIENLKNKVREVVRRKCDQLWEDIDQETDFTSRLMEALETSLMDVKMVATLDYGYSPMGKPSDPEYRVKPRVLKTQYPRSEENLSGADVMFGFKATINGVDINKSALVQAKLFKGKGTYRSLPDNKEGKLELFAQCKRMRKISRDHSYVFVYCKGGVRFYRAEDVMRTLNMGLEGLAYEDGMDLEEFVSELFQCTVGDTRVPHMNNEAFKEHLQRLEITEGFMVELERE